MPLASRLRTGTVQAGELLAQAVTHDPLTPAPTRSLLREEVYGRLRSWILEGLLPPDTRLRDVDIADALQVSRTPVREAIRRLQDEGLVVAEASRWTKVAPVDIEDADRLYPIVWTLERLAINLSSGWNATRTDALRACNDRLAKALAAGDAPAASDADTDFHRRIVGAAGNGELSAIVDQLKMRLRRLEVVYFDGAMAGEESVNEHEKVIVALAANDLETAGSDLEANWRGSLARLHTHQENR